MSTGHHRARGVNHLPAVEDRKPQPDDQRVGGSGRESPAPRRHRWRSARRSGPHQNVVEADTVVLVADRQQNPRRFRNTVGVELGIELLVDARCVAARRLAPLELRVGNDFVGGRIAFGDMPKTVVVKRMKRFCPQCLRADLIVFLPIVIIPRSSE